MKLTFATGPDTSVPRRSWFALVLLAAVLSSAGAERCLAQGRLDALAARLTVASEDGERWARLSAVGDLAVLAFEDPPPGLLFSDDDPFLAPRLSATADAGLGRRLLVHAMLRGDRGFDPGDDEGGDVRLDEIYLQLDTLDALRGRFRVGRFATAFGAWVGRHLARDNPLVSAPAIYDDLVPITDAAAPADVPAFAARRDAPENKDTWVPIVWGPSYATGAAFSLGAGDFDVTVEVKNAALSSPPESWNDGFDTDPTFTTRGTWHPGPAWTVGVSFSDGPYLREAAEATLPAGTDADAFDQTTIGADLTYEHHDVQLWAELVHSTFEVPGIGDADMAGGFVEVRYRPATRFWLAGRLNYSWFDEVDGMARAWDRHLTRAEIGLGYQHSARVQGKLEYGYGEQAGADTNGNHRLAVQIVVRL